MRSRKAPASATSGKSAINSTPAGVGDENVTVPTGFVVLWKSSSGTGFENLTPSGSITSPMRSGVGVVARPVIVRPSRETDLMCNRAYARPIREGVGMLESIEPVSIFVETKILAPSQKRPPLVEFRDVRRDGLANQTGQPRSGVVRNASELEPLRIGHPELDRRLHAHLSDRRPAAATMCHTSRVKGIDAVILFDGRRPPDEPIDRHIERDLAVNFIRGALFRRPDVAFRAGPRDIVAGHPRQDRMIAVRELPGRDEIELFPDRLVQLEPLA